MKPYSKYRSKPIKLKESDILKQVRDYLKMTGWFIIRNQQSMGSHKGLSDLTAIKNGKVIWIEIKRPGGKLSPYQIKFKEDIQMFGGIYIWLTSLDEAINFFKY
jgi:Holliday junction resolvase